MKTLVFTAKRLLDILDELEGIDNGELFSCCMFKIIHCEMIKLSYRNLRHDGETISSGQNIFVEELALAGRQTQDKILAFCCALDSSGKSVQPLIRKIKYIRKRLSKIEQREKSLSYWRLADYRCRYQLHRRRKNLLQQTLSFIDVGSLFFLLYKQRKLGSIAGFQYALMGYSRNLVKAPIVEPFRFGGLSLL